MIIDGKEVSTFKAFRLRPGIVVGHGVLLLLSGLMLTGVILNYYSWSYRDYSLTVSSDHEHYDFVLSNEVEYPSFGPTLRIHLPSLTIGIEVSNLSANEPIALVAVDWNNEVVANISELSAIEQAPIIVGSKTPISIYERPLRNLNVSILDEPVQVVFDLTIWTVSPPPPMPIVIFPWPMVIALVSVIVYALVRLTQIQVRLWKEVIGPLFVAFFVLSSLVLMLPYMYGYTRGDFVVVENTETILTESESFVLSETNPNKTLEMNIAIPIDWGGNNLETLVYRLTSNETIRLTALDVHNTTLTEFEFQGVQLEWWNDWGIDDLAVYTIQLSFVSNTSEVRFSYEGIRTEVRSRADPLPSMILVAVAVFLLPPTFWRALRIDYELKSVQEP